MTATESPGRLADNIAHFARALRRAGLPVGPATVIDAVQAVEAAGIGRRDDFYWTLHAVFVTRREHRPVFHEVFELFWGGRGLLARMIAMMSPVAPAPPPEKKKEKAAQARAREALQADRDRREIVREEEVEARLAVSARERPQPRLKVERMIERRGGQLTLSQQVDDRAGRVEELLAEGGLTGVYMRQDSQIQCAHEALCPLHRQWSAEWT